MNAIAEKERTPSLYEIEKSLQMLMQDREETEDPEELATIDAAIAEYVAKEIGKVDRIRAYIRYAENKVQAAKQAAAEATSYAQIWESRVRRVKDFALAAMDASGQKRLEGTAGTLSVRANGGVQPLVITDPAAIPRDCRKATIEMPADEWDSFREHMLDIGMTLISEKVEIDNMAIREAIADAGGVPGAHLGERGKHLQVR
jgi:hypothetical protein